MQLNFIQESEEPLTDDSEYDKKLPTGNFILFLPMIVILFYLNRSVFIEAVKTATRDEGFLRPRSYYWLFHCHNHLKVGNSECFISSTLCQSRLLL